MSSLAAPAIRKCISFWASLFVLASQPLAAQSDMRATVNEALDHARNLYGPPPPVEDCSDEQEAAILSGEIIVCRRKKDQSEFRTLPVDEAQSRYAREIMNKGNPQTPDVAGDGIFKGEPTVGGLCVPGLQKCPPPPALIIDVTALPKAPPGSDADRIARGLPPLGNDGSITESELGLPDPATINRVESEEPKAQR